MPHLENTSISGLQSTGFQPSDKSPSPPALRGGVGLGLMGSLHVPKVAQTENSENSYVAFKRSQVRSLTVRLGNARNDQERNFLISEIEAITELIPFPPEKPPEKPLKTLAELMSWSPQTARYNRAVAAPVHLSVLGAAQRSGFTFNLYPSGEITGARFTTGMLSQCALQPRTGPIVTGSLTRPAKSKVRRAIENSDSDFKCFMTLTFAPELLQAWQKNEDGTVRHDYAKYKISKFLHSIKQSRDRKSAITGRDEDKIKYCLLYTSPSPRDRTRSRMPSSA